MQMQVDKGMDGDCLSGDDLAQVSGFCIACDFWVQKEEAGSEE